MSVTIAIDRAIDLPGLHERMPPGVYKLIYRMEIDPIDKRQIYYQSGEAIRIEDGQRYVFWGHQVEALLQSPHVTITEPESAQIPAS